MVSAVNLTYGLQKTREFSNFNLCVLSNAKVKTATVKVNVIWFTVIVPVESKKYTRLMSHKKLTIALILEI